MLPSYLNKNGYVSCIKIAGMPILPPLVTEEKKEELLKDKARAVEIENKLKGKRSSIDSGVMTGSYIDNFKNGESSENTSSQKCTMADIPADVFVLNNVKSVDTENLSSSDDCFLKTALEDKEFRDFFYSTAERIFKDNNIEHSPEVPSEEDKRKSSDNLNNKESNIVDLCNASNVSGQIDLLDLSVCNNLNLVSKIANISPNKIEDIPPKTVVPDVKCIEPTPPRMVRRNSYTLESPSPVLLEHMSKNNEKAQGDKTKWQSYSDKEEVKAPHLGFKTFSASKPRKTWNKKPSNELFSRMKSCPGSPKGNRRNAIGKPAPLRRSNTFTKTRPKSEIAMNNFSLPSSSRTSPIHMLGSAQSTSCIPSILPPSDSQRPASVVGYYEERSPKSDVLIGGLNSFPSPNRNSKIPLRNDLTKMVTEHSNYDTDTLSTSHYDADDNTSQISTTVTGSVSPQPKWVLNQLESSRDERFKADISIDADDSVSMCSSLSLSKFLPVDSNQSRPSTADDISTLFSQLQLQHERQIAELLEKQHKEKIILARMHSNNGSVCSRNTSAMSSNDLSIEKNPSPSIELREMKESFNRQLFPNNNTSTASSTGNVKCFSSDKEKVAASKISAYARGYLTRRLLKTEKVRLLIEVIRESLKCAFIMQTEAKLKRNDLELHERLAHQLTAALYELQSIVCAPVAKRMAIIAADRERLSKLPSRPSSAISEATRRSILRRQQSLNNSVEKKSPEVRTRAKSFSNKSSTQGAVVLRKTSVQNKTSKNIHNRKSSAL